MSNQIHLFLSCLLIFSSPFNFATAQIQDTTIHRIDSSTIENITVTAFQSHSRWIEVPAAIAVLNEKQLQLVSYTSLVAGFNLVPGVRMEERSPGSYRLSIRGSLLRSPFGVRNVKIYWDDMPFTDAGGNTYLQLTDISQVTSAEIIKGPASSMYGANTGGALILLPTVSNMGKKNRLQGLIQSGSFGLFNEQLQWDYQGKKSEIAIRQSHTNSNGYRKQSSLHKDAIALNGALSLGQHTKWKFLASYTDLYYETPGGVNYSQMLADPRQARQATATLPGAEEQKASIRNKTIWAGTTLLTRLSDMVDNTTTLVMSHTDFVNPFITNYEIRDEWNYGGRTTFRLKKEKKNYKMQWLAGGEWQQNDAHLDNYWNNKGSRDTVLFRDKLVAKQYFFFTQLTLNFFKRWVVQAGTSSNKQSYRYRRLSNPFQADYLSTRQRSLFTPRISLLYKLRYNLATYVVAARGFSPPTLAEIRPSDGNYYPTLQPEAGWNYEAGIKGTGWDSRLLFDASVYYFRLEDAIVRRLNVNGDEYFVNAGSTTQKGIEAWLKGYIIRNPVGFISGISISHSFSYQPFYFDRYVSGNTDLSGNRLTGVPRSIHVSTAEVQSGMGLFTNVVYNFTSSIPLNDANDEWAHRYHLLQARIGWVFNVRSLRSNVFIGADNLLDERYSLGNDINAAGRRYYNPAPRRNYFAGLSVTL